MSYIAHHADYFIIAFKGLKALYLLLNLRGKLVLLLRVQITLI